MEVDYKNLVVDFAKYGGGGAGDGTTTRTQTEEEHTMKTNEPTFASIGYTVHRGFGRFGTKWFPCQAVILEGGGNWFFVSREDTAEMIKSMAESMIPGNPRKNFDEYFHPDEN